MVMILCLGVAAAVPQGLGGVGIGGQGGRPGQGQNFGLNRFNVITNPRARTCGAMAQFCYGQGLETTGAFPVNPLIVQCMLQAARFGNRKYLVRVDFTGEVFVTNNFGQAIGDIEPRQAGFGLAAHRQAQQAEFELKQIENEIEFCGGSR